MVSEYISRQAVVDYLNKLCDRVCQYSKAQRYVMCSSCPLGDAFIVIEDDIPAADVRPVVRARWIELENPNYSPFDPTSHEYDLLCSCCGATHYGVNKNFCSNCGADMRPREADHEP